MDDSTVFVGLDYHQEQVQVCVMNQAGQVLRNRGCVNDAAAIVEWVGARGAVHGAIEACSGAADLAEELIERGHWSMDLGHAGYVQKLKGSPDKTDWSDAQLLADLERVGYLPRVWLAPEGIRELRRLVRYRQQLAQERRAVKLRIGALLRDQRIADAPGRRWTKAWQGWAMTHPKLGPQSRWLMQQYAKKLAEVQQQLQEAEDRLEEATAKDAVTQKLRELPGIGLITATWLRAEIGRFDRFRSGKQLARFCGLSPRNASSGNREADAGLIRAANGALRTALIEAAWQIMRRDPRWREFAESLRRRGKAPSVVVAAVANRWVRWLYHQMKPLGLAA